MSAHIIGHTRPIARKPHACDYCGGAIPAGQQYLRWVWVGDGRASTCRAHCACNDVAVNLAALWDDDEWTVGPDELTEWARSLGSAAWPSALDALSEARGWGPGERERLGAWLRARVGGNR
jgi:hypothetical protein